MGDWPSFYDCGLHGWARRNLGIDRWQWLRTVDDWICAYG